MVLAGCGTEAPPHTPPEATPEVISEPEGLQESDQQTGEVVVEPDESMLEHEPAPSVTPQTEHEPAPSAATQTAHEPAPSAATQTAHEPAPSVAPQTEHEPAPSVAPQTEHEPTPSVAPQEGDEPSSTPTPKEERQREPEVSGLAFTETLIELLDHELNGRFLGWRPNDLVLGRLTDNVQEFQLGALEAIRYTAVKLKETLTRFGDADAFDPHLIEAVNLLMNRADQFWFPSAESQFKLALEGLRGFKSNLEQGKSHFYYRKDNLDSLITSYKDLLGASHENLVKKYELDGSHVSFLEADNYFYYAQGVAHVMFEMLKAVRAGFGEQLHTIDADELMDKIIEDLERAVRCKPWIITNANAGGILANHRYNLAASISSVLHNMNAMLTYGG
jgi:hypothetical protein